MKPPACTPDSSIAGGASHHERDHEKPAMSHGFCSPRATLAGTFLGRRVEERFQRPLVWEGVALEAGTGSAPVADDGSAARGAQASA
jgi:hypothetical protein